MVQYGEDWLLLDADKRGDGGGSGGGEEEGVGVQWQWRRNQSSLSLKGGKTLPKYTVNSIKVFVLRRRRLMRGGGVAALCW